MERKDKKLNKIISLILIVIILLTSYSIYTKVKPQNDTPKKSTTTKKDNKNNQTNQSELIDKVLELQKENSDIKGWIKIGDTPVDYPLLQGEDNEFYLSHNYKKESDRWGIPFIHTEADINNVNSNIYIYGHSSSDDPSATDIFSTLLLYKDQSYYDANKIITIATDTEEREYTIFSTFKSRVFYQDEVNVFRYYNYIDLSNKETFDEYIANVNNSKLYETGISAEFGEQILTLITCEYSVENGRMVIVAKRTK